MVNNLRKVSWEGMPCLGFKNFSNHSFFASPKSSIWTQDFAPQIAAQIAITRISIRNSGSIGVGQFFSSILQLKKMMKRIASIFELALVRGYRWLKVFLF
jgi:hypothetical protein